MKNKSSNFICANGSNCLRFRVKVSKKRTTSSLCPHEHIVMVVSGKNLENAMSTRDNESGYPCDEHKWLENTSKYLFENHRIVLSDINMINLEQKIVERNRNRGWSKVYQVEQKLQF